MSTQSEYLDAQFRYPADTPLRCPPPTLCLSEQDCIQKGKKWQPICHCGNFLVIVANSCGPN